MSTKLIDASTASSESSAVAFVTTPDRIDGFRVFKVVISAAANVLLQGRFHGDDTWHTINTYTETGAESVALFPHMRTSMNSNTGTVSAWLDV
jgi:hypothetical protein